MKTTLGIKNFRVFDEKGVEFKLEPITFLTGCNSSGKSSITKALFYLNYLLQGKDPYKLFPTDSLHSYKNIVHYGNEDKEVVVSYKDFSPLFQKIVEVSLNTDGNCILTADEETLVSGQFKCIKSIRIKPSILKAPLFKYLTIEKFWRSYYIDVRGIFENSESNYWDTLDEIRKNNKDNTFYKLIAEFFFRFRPINELLINKNEIYNELLSKSKEYDTLFYLPILEQIKNLKRDEFESLVLKKFEDRLKSYSFSNKESFFECIKVLAKDFRNSEHNTFLDYYKEKETEFLNFDNVDFNDFSPSDDFRDLWYFTQGYVYEPEEEEYCYASHEKLDEYRKQLSAEIGSFVDIFQILAHLNKEVCLYPDFETNIVYSTSYFSDYAKNYCSALFNCLKDYNELIINEAVEPVWKGKLSYVTSQRAMIKRLYPFSDNDEFTLLIKKYINTDSKDKGLFINEWVKNFKIGEKVVFNEVLDGLGAVIYIQKSDGRLSNIADEGYGITQLLSIILQIELAVATNNHRFVSNREAFLSLFNEQEIKEMENRRSDTIIIEEPEIHLHPRYQSLLTVMFYEAYIKYGIHFIIETHSEYMIRKSQLLVKLMNFNSQEELENGCPFRTYYIPENGAAPYSLEYRTDGVFANDFGEGFFDEAENLAFQIL